MLTNQERVDAFSRIRHQIDEQHGELMSAQPYDPEALYHSLARTLELIAAVVRLIERVT